MAPQNYTEGSNERG